MNLILFTPQEIGQPLALKDPRAQHLLKVLRRQPGDSFDAGLIDGPKGKGMLTGVYESSISLSFTWDEKSSALAPVILIVGLPRPQTARKILMEATTLGVEAIHFVATEKGEPSYAQSTLWSSGEWHRLLIAGAEQAFCTLLPVVTWGQSLEAVIGRLPGDGMRLVLDNHESPFAIGQVFLQEGKVTLAIGSERGWSINERALFRSLDFRSVHLGSRVLRTETAVVAATSIILSKLQY